MKPFVIKFFLLNGIPFCLFLLENVSAGPRIDPTTLVTCFDGYTLNESGKCIKLIDEAPRAVCPESDVEILDSKQARCKIRLPILKGCTEENQTQTENGDCMITQTTDVQYFCPAGYIDDGTKCLLKSPGAIVSRCIKGERSGDQCVETHVIQPLTMRRCPEGTIGQDERCWRVIDVFDCTDQIARQDEKRAPRIGLLGLRHLSGPKPPTGIILDRTIAVQPETSEDLVPVTAPKQFRVRIKSQMCEKLVEVNTVTLQQCPDGYMTRDTVNKKSTEKNIVECFKEEYSSLVSICAETNGPAEDCPPKVTYTPKQAICKNGTPGRKGHCEEVIVTPGTAYCPTDFVRENEFCIGYVDAPWECSAGLTMTPKHRCVGQLEYEPVHVTSLSQVDEDVPKNKLISSKKESQLWKPS